MLQSPVDIIFIVRVRHWLRKGMARKTRYANKPIVLRRFVLTWNSTSTGNVHLTADGGVLIYDGSNLKRESRKECGLSLTVHLMSRLDSGGACVVHDIAMDTEGCNGDFSPVRAKCTYKHQSTLVILAPTIVQGPHEAGSSSSSRDSSWAGRGSCQGESATQPPISRRVVHHPLFRANIFRPPVYLSKPPMDLEQC
jgi:hypothetical protein